MTDSQAISATYLRGHKAQLAPQWRVSGRSVCVYVAATELNFAAAVILLIVQILFLIIGRGDSSFISKMLSFASAITSITFAITAFTACGNWNDLTKDINDDLPSDWEFELGYSWYLMLFSGLFAIGVVVLSVIIFCQDVKGKSDNSLLNNA